MSDPLKEAMAVLDAYMAGLNRGDEAAPRPASDAHEGYRRIGESLWLAGSAGIFGHI